MNSNTCTRATIAFVTLCLVAAGAAQAQTDEEVNGAVQFNFTTPGARSLALGGAFLGLADDATAAFTNPAGLTQLSKTEVSIEGRQFSFSSPYAWGGHINGAPSGEGVDQTAGIIFERSEEEINNVSFVSFVYPRGPWAVALYSHLLADFEANFQTQGAFNSAGEGTFRLFAIRTAYDLAIRNIGISFAYRFGESFSIGVGFSNYSLDLDSFTRRYRWPDFTAAPEFTESSIVNFQEQTGDDDDTGINVGFLWKLGEKFSIGGTYREGPSFDVAVRNTTGAPGDPNPDDPQRIIVADTASFNTPDVYGLGVAIRPNQNLTFTLDWSRVNYSSLTEGFVILFPGDGSSVDEFKIDDADEFHLGVEHVFSRLKRPLSIRIGGWHDPDHKLRYEGASRGNTIRHFQGDDEFHYSVGFGLVFSTKFQIDTAADFSDLVDTISLSGVYRF